MPIGKDKPLTLLKPGQLLGSKTANVLITFYNAFLKSAIVPGLSSEVLIADNGIILKIGPGGAGGGSGGGRYKGEYTPDGNYAQFFPSPYVFGDIVRITPGNVNATTDDGDIIPGVYICIQNGPTVEDLPNHPLSPGGETAFWHCLATYPTTRQFCDASGDLVAAFVDSQDAPT